MTAARNLVAQWEAFLDETGASCPIHVTLHKGTLYAYRSYVYGQDRNVAFGVESAMHGPGHARSRLVVTGAVFPDLEGTPWAARLVRQPMTSTRDYLKDIEVFTLQRGNTRQTRTTFSARGEA